MTTRSLPLDALLFGVISTGSPTQMLFQFLFRFVAMALFLVFTGALAGDLGVYLSRQRRTETDVCSRET